MTHSPHLVLELQLLPTMLFITPADRREGLLRKVTSLWDSPSPFPTRLIIIIVFLFVCLRKVNSHPFKMTQSLVVQSIFTRISVLTLPVPRWDKNSYDDSGDDNHFKCKKVKSSNLSAGSKASTSDSEPRVLSFLNKPPAWVRSQLPVQACPNFVLFKNHF